MKDAIFVGAHRDSRAVELYGGAALNGPSNPLRGDKLGAGGDNGGRQTCARRREGEEGVGGRRCRVVVKERDMWTGGRRT